MAVVPKAIVEKLISFDVRRWGAPHGSAKLAPAEVRDLFHPNETLLVDITIKRQMRDVFRFLEPPPAA